MKGQGTNIRMNDYLYAVAVTIKIKYVEDMSEIVKEIIELCESEMSECEDMIHTMKRKLENIEKMGNDCNKLMKEEMEDPKYREVFLALTKLLTEQLKDFSCAMNMLEQRMKQLPISNMTKIKVAFKINKIIRVAEKIIK